MPLLIPKTNTIEFVIPEVVDNSTVFETEDNTLLAQRTHNFQRGSFRKTEYFQPELITRITPLQVQSSEAVSVRIYDYDTNVPQGSAIAFTKIVDLISGGASDKDIYRIDIDWLALGIGVGRYYLIITGSDAGSDPISEPIELAESFENHISLLYRNFDTAHQIYWDSAAIPLSYQLLIPGQFLPADPGGEKDVYFDDENSPITLYADVIDAYTLKAYGVPNYLRRKLKTALACDRIELNSIPVDSTDALESSPIANNNTLYNIEVRLIRKGFDYQNDFDSNITDDTQALFKVIEFTTEWNDASGQPGPSGELVMSLGVVGGTTVWNLPDGSTQVSDTLTVPADSGIFDGTPKSVFITTDDVSSIREIGKGGANTWGNRKLVGTLDFSRLKMLGGSIVLFTDNITDIKLPMSNGEFSTISLSFLPSLTTVDISGAVNWSSGSQLILNNNSAGVNLLLPTMASGDLLQFFLNDSTFRPNVSGLRISGEARVQDMGLSSTEVNQLMIGFDSSTLIGSVTINLTGNNGEVTGDGIIALLSLESKGATVTAKQALIRFTTNWNDSALVDGQYQLYVGKKVGADDPEWVLPDGSTQTTETLTIPADSGILDGTNKDIRVLSTSTENIISINPAPAFTWNGRKLVGTLDLSRLKALEGSIRAALNSFQSVILPDSSSNIDYVQLSSNQFIESIDFSVISNWEPGAILEPRNAGSLTSIVFPTTSTQIGGIDCDSTGVSDFDLSGMTNLTGEVDVTGPGITSLILPPNADGVTTFRIRNSGFTTEQANDMLVNINSSVTNGVARDILLDGTCDPISNDGSNGYNAKVALEAKGFTVAVTGIVSPVISYFNDSGLLGIEVSAESYGIQSFVIGDDVEITDNPTYNGTYEVVNVTPGSNRIQVLTSFVNSTPVGRVRQV